jgi:hypothetical protein
MNEITLTLLRSMILMTQAVIDAANRAAASESVAAAVIGRLADRNAALSAENASLTVQLAAAVAAGNDDAAEAAVAGVLTVATDGLDAAVVAAEPPPVVVAPVADAVAA